MTQFLIAAVALAAIALLVLLRPWWARSLVRRATGQDAQRALNTAIYKDQLAELERDRAANQLSEADYREAREELQRRLLEDTAEHAEPPAAAGARATWVLLALALPLAAAGLYWSIGNPDAMLSETQQEAKALASLESMVGKLEAKLAAQPDNPEGWVMLSRSYAAMGRIDDAARAFEKVGPSLEQNPDLMTTYAEILLQQTQGDFAGRPRELIAKALARDPNHIQGLLLAGPDAMESGRPALAVELWQRLLKQLEPGSEDARMIQSAIESARARMTPAEQTAAGKAKVSPGGTAPGSTGPQASAAAEAISGVVDIAPALRAKLAPEDALFIFARAVDGPRMPLAAIRARAGDLPLKFSLGDAQAMAGAKISSAGPVRIEAKISKSGSAGVSPGDLTGKSAPVKAGARGVTVLIDAEAK